MTSAVADRRRAPVQLFAAAPDDPRALRAIDGVRFVAFGIVLLVAALLSVVAADLDRQIFEVLRRFPGFLEVFGQVGFWSALGWSAALVVIALADRRFLLAAEALASTLLAIGGTVAAAAIVHGAGGDVLSHLLDLDGPPVFPPAALAISSAVIAVMAPYLTLPFRRLGRGIVTVQLLGCLFLGTSLAFGAMAAVAIGLMAGAALNLVVGSPGGLPTVARVRNALADLGVQTDDLALTDVSGQGVSVLSGSHAGSPVQVKVYGRDAWEGELLANLWRLVWYRGDQRTARLRRSQYVEHEGFMTLLAGSSGVDVPQVVVAGLADNGDALIVLRPHGTPVDLEHPALTATQARALWDALAGLHAGGIVHRHVDLDRITVIGPDAAFSDLSSSHLRRRASDDLADHAQLFALTVVASGFEIATAEATRALGAGGVAAMLPYLQHAAMAPLVRAATRRQSIDLDGIRDELAATLDTSDIELVKVRRVTGKSLLRLALFGIATYTIIGMISGLDLASFARDLADANWWWLLTALLIAQLPRITNAVSTMGSSTKDLPLGPTTALQFAMCYVNLAVPSSAGQVAATTRYFQRFGVPPATALSAGVIDSVSELLVQLGLFVSVLLISDVDLGLSLQPDQLQGVATLALIVLGVALAAGAVALAVPSVRSRLKAWREEARSALEVLRTPRRLLQLFGGNVASRVLFAIALSACVHAFGYDVPLSSLILIDAVVGLFAGLIPTPGGIGVTEAGISLGLSRVGVPPETAFAIALTYRFCTFYLPPIWGFQSYRWLTRHQYL